MMMKSRTAHMPYNRLGVLIPVLFWLDDGIYIIITHIKDIQNGLNDSIADSVNQFTSQ